MPYLSREIAETKFHSNLWQTMALDYDCNPELGMVQ